MNRGRENLLKGSQAEAFAVNRLIQLNLSVSMPVFKECKYDCIVDISGGLFRTQIKKLHREDGRDGRIITKLTSGHYDSKGEMNNKKYTEEDIDAFLLVDLEKENCFWMLFHETPTSSITLSYKRSQQNINYYKDYLLENRIDSESMGGSEAEDLSGSVFQY
jgi:hypothetical protein